MDFTYLYSPGFVREWNRQRLTDEDLVALEEEIARAPESAPVVRGTGGLRKIRFAPPSWHAGKSASTRVGFAYFRTKSAIVVVSMFSKKDEENFSAAQRAAIAKWLRKIEGTL